MKLRLRLRATTDIENAAHRYWSVSPELSDRFLRALDSTIAVVADHPLAATAVRSNIRRALVRDFPYGVFYRVEDDWITVLRVLHQHRDPRVARNLR
jgi:plasmid stabilization system protein ParE